MHRAAMAFAALAGFFAMPLPAVADSCTEHAQQCQMQSCGGARSANCRTSCDKRKQACLQTANNGACAYTDANGTTHRNLQCS